MSFLFSLLALSCTSFGKIDVGKGSLSLGSELGSFRQRILSPGIGSTAWSRAGMQAMRGQVPLIHGQGCDQSKALLKPRAQDKGSSCLGLRWYWSGPQESNSTFKWDPRSQPQLIPDSLRIWVQCGSIFCFFKRRKYEICWVQIQIQSKSNKIPCVNQYSKGQIQYLYGPALELPVCNFFLRSILSSASQPQVTSPTSSVSLVSSCSTNLMTRQPELLIKEFLLFGMP